MKRYLPLSLLAGFSIASSLPAADTAAQIKGMAPVSVSSANYRKTGRDELVRAVEGAPAAINPDTPQLKALAKPQYFIFQPGEIYESDLTYDQVTALLNTALAKKGYLNAADPQGIIREPAKVGLILRINYGTRPWRLPTVRSEDLSWRDGMVQPPKGKGLHNLGAEQVWDYRAGGNDDALGASAKNSANGQSFQIGAGGTGSKGGGGSAEGSANVAVGGTTSMGLSDIGSTRDFNLIVVDAFDYQELKENGKAAKRLWTTFVSAPKQPGQKFSQIVDALLRNATPFFGETSTGLQVYTDVRAEVTIGEVTEVKEPPQK